MFLRLLLSSIIFFAFLFSNAKERIDLSGTWNYRLDNAPTYIPGEGEIILPNTLDNAHKSIFNPPSDNTTQLRNEFSFIGNAVYSRTIEIPDEWGDKEIVLFLERTKPTTLKIDGDTIGSNSRISSPQAYNLTGRLTPGYHFLEISVNNFDSIPPIVARSSHATSGATQTNWNGILGDFYLEARNPVNIKNVTVDDRNNKLTLHLSKSSPEKRYLRTIHNGDTLELKTIPAGSDSIDLILPLKTSDYWSAQNPVLHDFRFLMEEISGNIVDSCSLQTGFRDFKSEGKQFYNNGIPVFLRGTVNAAVFPLTGYAPVDKESWTEYFSVLKEYGLNHVRFHSWTPPRAAFEAADKAGVYILTELPIWGELDRDLKFHNTFLKEELEGIMASFSIHPSFVMFSTGNELWGDLSLMSEYMTEAKALNPRILATQGSNVYLGMNGEIGGEDFLISAKTGDDVNSYLRGSLSFADSQLGGHLNSTYPESRFNYSQATKGIEVPVISHEIGQYQTYPDFSEIDKYTGQLKPDNLIEFCKRAIEVGTDQRNKEFSEASGKWVAKLYKAEMELAQRSGIAGYELFGIQDYPGQGTALVGILNPFMESKGYITTEDWKKSSSDLLLLAEFPKFCFTENELVNIPVSISNYTSKPDTVRDIIWEIGFDNGLLEFQSGSVLQKAGSVIFRVPSLKYPQKFSLDLKSTPSDVTNTYDFWVYPKNLPPVKNVFVTSDLEEALALLEKGKNVILCPDSATLVQSSIDHLFTTDFFNYRMYRTICDEMNIKPSPGTLGLLIDDDHPSLKVFPTENHTNWQWYSIIANSRPLIIDRLPQEVVPIVEVIDNVERNFRLALLLECRVGKGKLMIFPADLNKIMEYPEGRWFMQSLKEYVAGKDFKPTLKLTPTQVKNLITKPSASRMIKELKNETYHRF